MPQLKTTRETAEVELPQIPGGKVQIYKNLTAADSEAIQVAKSEGRSGTLTMVARLIKEWNLTDEKEQPLPVTESNVGLLDARDLRALNDKVQELLQNDFLGEKGGSGQS